MELRNWMHKKQLLLPLNKYKCNISGFIHLQGKEIETSKHDLKNPECCRRLLYLTLCLLRPLGYLLYSYSFRSLVVIKLYQCWTPDITDQYVIEFSLFDKLKNLAVNLFLFKGVSIFRVTAESWQISEKVKNFLNVKEVSTCSSSLLTECSKHKNGYRFCHYALLTYFILFE
jgi:hypothetical protein